jgi:hypothetical protein
VVLDWYRSAATTLLVARDRRARPARPRCRCAQCHCEGCHARRGRRETRSRGPLATPHPAEPRVARHDDRWGSGGPSRRRAGARRKAAGPCGRQRRGASSPTRTVPGTSMPAAMPDSPVRAPATCSRLCWEHSSPRGIDARSALRLAVCLHGAAAEACVRAATAPLGLTAGELPRAARALLNAR